jgi:lysophospholipid hydrolase
VTVEGTVARATVDSTLAVIPIEAFKKLTRKFPKATGSIVQVVLERFSRVTFMTAHKFLGLTKEILRSEATLNHLVSYPLPRHFYTGGGMQALREKFQPESKPTRKFSTTSTVDYFSEQPSPTVRAPSLPSSTPLKSNTPAAKLSRLPSEELIVEMDEESPDRVVSSPVPMSSATPKSTRPSSPRKKAAAGLTITPSQKSADGSPVKPEYFSPPPASAQRPHAFVRQASAMRKEVTPGDLATTHGHDADVGDTYYRPLKTPGLPRMDTWRGRTPVSSNSFAGSRLDSDIDDEGDLRDALVRCIAKSIGLFQPADSVVESSQGQSSVAPSMNMSAQGSPMFHPAQRVTSNGRPPFGNVLDMMNASTPESNNVSGLLRESLLKARAEEDETSSVSASFRGGSFHGTGSDVNQKIMRDMGERIEVLYFKKGTTLVKQGERSSGLYYVIDGFLDVSAYRAALASANAIQISIKTAGDPWAEAPTISSQMSKRPFGAAMGQREPQSPRGWQQQPKREEEQLFTIKVSLFILQAD